MSGAPAIEAYLRQLAGELLLRRAPRRRLLLEAEDHLRSQAAELVAAGWSPVSAEGEAVARFGAAGIVAGRFAHAAASAAARVAFAATALAVALYVAVAVVYLASAPGWLRDFPQGAPTMIALQVAAVALALSAVRARRSRGEVVIAGEQLRFLLNGALVASIAVAAAALAELLVALTRPAAAPWAQVRPLVGVFGVAAATGLPALVLAVRSRGRATALRLEHRTASREEPSLAADVAAVLPPLAGAARWALAKPDRICALVATLAFVTVAGVQLIGTDFAHHASSAIGAAAVGVLEATAIVGAYLTLGRALGLRPARR